MTGFIVFLFPFILGVILGFSLGTTWESTSDLNVKEESIEKAQESLDE